LFCSFLSCLAVSTILIYIQVRSYTNKDSYNCLLLPLVSQVPLAGLRLSWSVVGCGNLNSPFPDQLFSNFAPCPLASPDKKKGVKNTVYLEQFCIFADTKPSTPLMY
jgi:hypothetical protein